MRWITRGCICILLFYLGLVLFTNRALFFSSFNVSYWQDKFEHSQWSMPLSVRTIGDDGLYLWAGYRLMHGADPTLLNAETPPLGKYLIGASIALFHNGYLYGFFSTISILALCYTITYVLLKNRLLASGVTLLIATDPLITSQYSLTMLDSIQTVFLLISLLALILATKKYSGVVSVTAGICLGLFSETKFPIFTPLFYMTYALYLWKLYGSIRPVIRFTCGAIIGYLIPYIPYFFMGHSLLDWMRVQKWVITFYRNARLTPTWGSALANLLIGQYQNIFTRGWGAASHWSPSWTIITILPLIGMVRSIQKKHYYWVFISIILLLSVCIDTVIPFWTRYLVLSLPLLYITSAYVMAPLSKKLQIYMLLILFICNVASSVPILFTTPEATANQIAYNYEHMFFRDMYEDITSEGKSRWTSDTFNRFALTTVSGAQIEAVHITMSHGPWVRFVPQQTLHLVVTYETRNLGSFTEAHDIPLVKQDGRWRIPWDWSMFLNDLSDGISARTTVDPASRGSLLASDKKPIAADVPSDMIWVTPKNVDRTQEATMLKFIEGLFEGKIAAVYFHQRINGNTLPDLPVPLGVPPLPLTQKQRATLVSFPGVTLTPSFGRTIYGSAIITIGEISNTHFTECCSHLYTTTTYDGISGAELTYNSMLKGVNGGTLELIDQAGSVIRTIIHIDKKEGEDAAP